MRKKVQPVDLVAELAVLARYFSEHVGQPLRFALADAPANVPAPDFLSPKRQVSWGLGRAALAELDLPNTTFPAIGVSLTHTHINGDLVAIALRQETPPLMLALGVDAEPIRPRRPGLAQRILTPTELEALTNSAHRDDFNATVLRLWSVKEAVWKARQSLGEQETVTSSPVTRAVVHTPLSLESLATLDGVTFSSVAARLGDAWLSVAWAQP